MKRKNRSKQKKNSKEPATSDFNKSATAGPNKKGRGNQNITKDDEQLTGSSNQQIKLKESEHKGEDSAGSSLSSSKSVKNKALKRKHKEESDEIIPNFWQKSKEKYQKISRRSKKRSTDSDYHSVSQNAEDVIIIQDDQELPEKPTIEDSGAENTNLQSKNIAGTSESRKKTQQKKKKRKLSKSKEEESRVDSVVKDISYTAAESDGEEGLDDSLVKDISFTAAEADGDLLIEVDLTEIEEETKGFTVIDLPVGVMVTLEQGTELCFHGSCRLQPLCGSVLVFGSHLKCGKQYDIFSPDTHSFLTIKCAVVESNSSKIESIFTDLGVDFRKLGSNVPPKKLAAFKIIGPDSRLFDIIPKYPPFQQIFRKREETTKLPKWKLFLLKVGLTLIENGPKMCFPTSYSTVTDMAYRIMDSPDCRPVFTVIGGKNSGKSTLNRYLVNSILNKVDKVYFLECDVGQTELTPPGCVSLHCISEPLLGPPFTHQRTAVYSCFFGGVTPGDDPTRYLTCIEECFSKYLEVDGKQPLVVNTMGWNKGVGLALTVDTIRLVRPLLLVQINSLKTLVNFPEMSPTFVHLEPGWKGKLWDKKWRYIGSKPEYKWIAIDSSVNVNDNQIARYKPLEHRDLALYSYFSSNLELGMTFNSVIPYIVPWKSVAIHVCHATVENSQILYSINGNLVALCHADLTQAKKLEEDSPWFFKNTPVCQCLGYGVVQGIDPSKQELYVVTPLSLEELQNVNTLLKGNVSLPNQLILKQKCKGPIPYVTNKVSTVGSEVLRQRHQPPRKPAPDST